MEKRFQRNAEYFGFIIQYFLQKGKAFLKQASFITRTVFVSSTQRFLCSLQKCLWFAKGKGNCSWCFGLSLSNIPFVGIFVLPSQRWLGTQGDKLAAGGWLWDCHKADNLAFQLKLEVQAAAHTRHTTFRQPVITSTAAPMSKHRSPPGLFRLE